MIFVALALAMTAPVPTASVAALSGDEPRLAVASLSQGRSGEAIALLESELAANPHDPAVMINLGVAHAQNGDDATARGLFKAAMACDQVVDLDTADGATLDSRRAARRALAMLERGEFRPAVRTKDTLTLRD